jgi:hypothetical protein
VFTIDLEVFSLLYLSIGIGVLAALWVYYDFRDARRLSPLRVRTIYQCIRCGMLYARRGRRDAAPCPSCEFQNDRLHF